VRAFLARLLALVRRRRTERELAEEIAAHLEFAEADHIASGMSAADARLAARQKFGGVLQTHEAYRDRLSVPGVESMWQDLKYAVRGCRTRPGFTAVATLPLAVGIGATSAIFSVADAELLRPLPVRDPGMVVTVGTVSPGDTWSGMSYPNYRDVRDASQSFEGLVAYRRSTPMTFARSPESAREVRMGMLVSDNFFEVLAVQPAMGRMFTAREARDPGSDPVIVLGYDFWNSILLGDPSVVNDVVWINGIEFTVVGIAADTFTGMDESIPAFYVPLTNATRLAPADNLLDDRRSRALAVKGRLKVGVSRRQAAVEMTGLWTALERQYPDANRNRTSTVRSQLEERIHEEGPTTVIVMALLMALVAVVLVIACANVASLMLGRSRARSREIAIRLALGVSRRRLVRQLLTESLVLAFIGCVLGLGFASGGLRLLRAAFPPADLRLVVAPQLDHRVLLVCLLAGVLSALLFGLAPARQSLKTELVAALRAAEPGQATRHRTIGRNLLVIAQIAMSLVLLLLAAGLFDGFQKVFEKAPGFRTDKVATMSLDTSIARYTPRQTRDFYRHVIDTARALPGVTSVALTSRVPLDRGADVNRVSPEGYRFEPGQESATVFSAVVDEHYFATIKTEVVRGRAFTADDKDTSRHVAIVNEEFAKRYWPNQDPIGRRLRLDDNQDVWLEVVGMTRTGKYLFVAEPPTPFLYLPFAQHDRSTMTLLVESAAPDPGVLSSPLRKMVRALDVNVPILNIRTLASIYERRAREIPWRILQLVGTIGLIGLILALIGLYGLVAYLVARRTREIGIRMAIGASTTNIVVMVIGQGLRLSIAGILVGSFVSVAVTRLVAASMAGLGTPDPVTYLTVPLMLLGTTIAASYLPAHRASRVDPLRTLRYE
jgi:putative ABC transport system permease protein